jgi:integrase
MPTQALTADFLATLSQRTPEEGCVNYFDTEIKGFLLEHRSTGGATFYFRYRDASSKLRLSRIGRSNEISASDARAKAHQLKKMVSEGGDPKLEQNRLKEVPTLESFIVNRYLPYVKARKRSWQTDETLLRLHLLPAFGQHRLNRISRSDVIDFQRKAQTKGYAPGTCNRMIVLLKFVFNCAIRWDVLFHTNPCNGVPMLEDCSTTERYLTAQEANKLFLELEANRNTQVGQVIRLLLYTGARKREILDAKWDEVDFKRKILTVPAARSKSKKPRYIPLSDAAIKLLESMPKQQGVPWVFYNPKTKKPPVSIFVAWNTIRKRVGLQDVRLHDLRHSYASFLVNAGRSLYEVQKLLGHHDPKITMRYAHLAPESLLEAVNMVANVVSRSKATKETLP